MNILVTGAAGFIGSHLCRELLRQGHDVIGIDACIGPTPLFQKEQTIAELSKNTHFRFLRESLLDADLQALLKNVDVVYHLAAIPGVRSSWGRDFELYAMHNILATQRLLEACRDVTLQQFIFASTSSVYGEQTGKVTEDMPTRPLSPYGVTKLTCEKLCSIYQRSFGIPIVTLRYFTVYGPGQRPDMAFHRFLHQMMTGIPITVFGNGQQTRDFTYIDDCIQGTAAVLSQPGIIGETINIGGKERASVIDVISLLENMTGISAMRTFTAGVPGEPRHTWADISKAEQLLSYEPKTTLKEGLQQEYKYLLERYGRG